MSAIPVQPDLFGGASDLPDFHVVTAHTRLLHDGTEVFVPEHLRWNRGPGVAPRAKVRRTATGDRGQIPLFRP